MPELLTAEEAAAHLRMSERKLYELIAARALPCTKVSGRWLFPKAELDRWVLSGLVAVPGLIAAPPPPIIGGSQDPLLEWALRESGCGLASLPEGSEAGLRRLTQGQVAAAAIHLHRIGGDDENANSETVAQTPGLHDSVVIAFARREQGLLVAPGNPLRLKNIADAARARMAQRQEGAGAQLLLLALLAKAGLSHNSRELSRLVCATGPDLAQAIRSGHANCGIATRSAARAAGLDFIPLVWERFDLVMRQRDYFGPALQALTGFMRQPRFRDQARELGGYDVADANLVRFSN